MKRLAAIPALAGLAILVTIIPTLVFLGAALSGGMGVAASITALAEQFVADKANLLAISLLGLVPLLLIAVLVLVRRLLGRSAEATVAYVWGGGIPVLAVTAFVNFEYWPSYLPARQFLGFPHGLEFVIGPLFFAPIGVLLGFLVAWQVVRRT